MTDLNITKDDIGKVFICQDGIEAVITKFRPAEPPGWVVQACREGMYWSYYTNGKMNPISRNPLDLIKRKEETMWIKHDGTKPNFKDKTIIEARFKTGETTVGYSWEFGWTITQPERYVVKEYRIVEAAPEEKPEPKRVELKDLWKVWIYDGGEIVIEVYDDLKQAKTRMAETAFKPLAITKGDAIGFYEGEGL